LWGIRPKRLSKTYVTFAGRANTYSDIEVKEGGEGVVRQLPGKSIAGFAIRQPLM